MTLRSTCKALKKLLFFSCQERMRPASWTMRAISMRYFSASSGLSVRISRWLTASDGSLKNAWAACNGMKMNWLSYSYMPTSKVPTTVKVRMRGTVPKAVRSPSGEISLILSPLCSRMFCAMRWPITTPSRPLKSSMSPRSPSEITGRRSRSSCRIPRTTAPVA